MNSRTCKALTPSQRLLSAALAVALAGCSSGTPDPAAPAAAASSGGEHHGGGGHHRDMPPAVTAFHDVLAPLWHSEAGAERDRNTCRQVQTLQERAQAVSQAPPPESVQPRVERWTASAAQLASATEALVRSCGMERPMGVAQHLEAVHTAFHGLIEVLRGEGHH